MSILSTLFGKQSKKSEKQTAMERFDRAFEDHELSHAALQESVSSLQQAVAVNDIVTQEQTRTVRKLAKDSNLNCAMQCDNCAFFTASGESTGVCRNKFVKMTVRKDYSCEHFEKKK
jgi:hypothetical protein